MNILNKFNNFLETNAYPLVNKLDNMLDMCSKTVHNRTITVLRNIDNQIAPSGSSTARTEFAELIRNAAAVLPVSVAAFVVISSLSTPALILVGSGAIAAALIKEEKSKTERILVVTSALTVTVALTAIKLAAAVVAFNGFTLAAVAVGATTSVALYTCYRWLVHPASTPKTDEIKKS